MNIADFKDQLVSLKNEEELNDFCRKLVLHGIPFIFKDDEHSYYEFRKKLQEIFKFLFMKFI